MNRLVLLLTLLLSPIAAPASATPPGSDKLRLSFESFIADEAGIFSPAFMDDMKPRLLRIHNQADLTILLVSVPALKGADAGKVARGVGESFVRAEKAHEDWAVFLLAPVDREISIVFSSSNSAAANELKAMADAQRQQLFKDLADGFDQAVTPFFKVDDWEGGMRAGVEALEGQLGKSEQSAPPAAEAPAESGAAA